MRLNNFANIIFTSSKISAGNMSFKLSSFQEVSNNRNNLAIKLGIDPKRIVSVMQIHSNKIINIKRSSLGKEAKQADGLLTNQKNIYLLIKTADCLPTGFYDPKTNVLALIHISRQNLPKGIIEKTIKKMAKEFHSQPKELIVKIGPSIGPCHYHMDLWQLTEDRLVTLGILKENIDNPKICTFESKEYFSHRRSVINSEPDLRFATVLGMRI